MVRLRRTAARSLARLWWVVTGVELCLAVCCLTTPVWGQSRYGELEHIQLGVESSEVPGCPDHRALGQWVNVLVGRQFVREGALIRVQLVVSPVGGDAPETLRAVLTATRREDASAPELTLREFQQKVSCDEIAMAAALTLSLLAARDVPPPSLAAAAEPTPSSPSMTMSQLSASSRRTALVASGSASNGTITDVGPSAVVPRNGRRPGALRLLPQFGVASDVGVGANPGVGIGASVFFGAKVDTWALRFLGNYAAGTSARAIGGGQVMGTTWGAELFVCHEAAARLTLCASGGPTWLVAWGRGFEVDRRTVLSTVRFGALGSYLWPVSETVSLGPAASFVVPLRPVELKVLGDEEVAWRGPPMAGRLSLLVQWR